MTDPLAREVLLTVAAVVVLVCFGALAVGGDIAVRPAATVIGAAIPPAVALAHRRLGGFGRDDEWTTDRDSVWHHLAVALGATLATQVLVGLLPRRAMATLVWSGIGAAAATLGVVLGAVAWRGVAREQNGP